MCLQEVPLGDGALGPEPLFDYAKLVHKHFLTKGR